MAKKLTINELNTYYEEADTCDKNVFSEYRSNVLLMAGEHYNKGPEESRREGAKNKSRLKLRIVKNHIHRIIRHYVTSILSYSPGVQIVPQDESSMQDQKSAELNQKVWEKGKSDYDIKAKIRSWCNDFCGVGEVAVKMFRDPNKGKLVGYEQKLDEDGTPLFDEMMQPIADESRPTFSGAFEFERIFAANLKRAPEAKEMKTARYLIYTKMVDVKHLKEVYAGEEDKIKMIAETQNEEYIVFDANRSSYTNATEQTAIREFYFRPCYEYPNGWYVICTSSGILEENELPFGIYPIVLTGFDEYITTPRGRSIIKVARPYVAEVNRASSQMALHQVTIGDDKVLYQKGTKLEQGGLLPGVRGITFQGREPTVLAGRDGSQYLSYIQTQIAEMEQAVMLDEINQEKQGQQDPMALLYRAANQHRKFSGYAEKFELFLVDVAMTYLALAKKYLSDEELLECVGREDIGNVEEFRNSQPQNYQIKGEPRDETLETMLGKTLQFQNLLQYAGSQLTREDIGTVMQQMPFGNTKEAFGHFTMESDNVKNDMLALERGKKPLISRNDDPDFMVQHLKTRMRKPDYEYLDPMIQQAYDERVQIYEQMIAENEQKVMAMKNEYIPSDGPLSTVDIYIEDENDPTKPAKRAKLPQKALEWLIDTLEVQGNSQDRLESLHASTLAELAGQMVPQGGMGSPNGMGMPQMPMSGPPM